MLNPKELRDVTDSVLKIFSEQQAVEYENIIKLTVIQSIEKADKLAKDAAACGNSEVIIYEAMTDRPDAVEVDDLPIAMKEVIKRLTSHFQDLGFQTRISGPSLVSGTDYTSFDLLIRW